MRRFIFEPVIQLAVFHSGTLNVFQVVSLHIILLDFNHFFPLLFTAFFNTSIGLQSNRTRFQLCLRASWVIDAELFGDRVKIAGIRMGLDR